MYFSAKKLGVPERVLTDFGPYYCGFYCDKDGTRHVGYVGVRPEHRGHGYFRAILSAFTESKPKTI